MTPERTDTLCAWIAFVAILLGTAAGNTHAFQARLLPNDLNSPILAMELLRCPEQLAAVVGAPSDQKNNRREMQRLTIIDFAFITAYTCLFVLAGVRLLQRAMRRAGIFVIITGGGAAIFDVLENLKILKALECLCTTPRTVSLVKWSLTFTALIALSLVFIDRMLPPLRRSIGYFAALFCTAAGFVGLAGVVTQLDPLIEKGAALMGIGLVTGWLFFATRSALGDGLVSGLNRLATVPAMKRLSTWPSDDT